jgi:hypothetical protein
MRRVAHSALAARVRRVRLMMHPGAVQLLTQQDQLLGQQGQLLSQQGGVHSHSSSGASCSGAAIPFPAMEVLEVGMRTLYPPPTNYANMSSEERFMHLEQQGAVEEARYVAGIADIAAARPQLRTVVLACTVARTLRGADLVARVQSACRMMGRGDVEVVVGAEPVPGLGF